MPRTSKHPKRAAKKKSQSQVIVSVGGAESKNASSDIVAVEHPQHFFRAIPNISDLALHGGLDPSSGQPYRVGRVGNDYTMDAYGPNTATVEACVARGWEKYIFATRQICIEHPEARDPQVIMDKYPDTIGCLAPEWIQRNIIERKDATDDREMAHEIDDKLRSYPTIGSALRMYPLPEHDTRPYPVQQGAIAARRYEELKKMRQASRSKPVSEDTLRRLYSDFEVWSVMHKLPEHLHHELFVPSIGAAKEDLLLLCVGHTMDAGIHSVRKWIQHFRNDMRLARTRRTSE